MKIERVYLSPIVVILLRILLSFLIMWSSYVVVDLIINEFEQPQIVKWGIEINFYSYLVRYIVVDLIGVYLLFFVIKSRK